MVICLYDSPVAGGTFVGMSSLFPSAKIDVSIYKILDKSFVPFLYPPLKIILFTIVTNVKKVKPAMKSNTMNRISRIK